MWWQGSTDELRALKDPLVEKGGRTCVSIEDAHLATEHIEQLGQGLDTAISKGKVFSFAQDLREWSPGAE
jgi:hypothetical protein